MDSTKQTSSNGAFDNGFEECSSCNDKLKLDSSEKEANMKLEAMRRYVETIEQKNSEHIKVRRKQHRELEQRNREVKFYEKHCANLQNEVNVLRNQLESTTRLSQSNCSAKISTRSYTMVHQQSNNVKVPQLLIDLKNLQHELENSNKEGSNLKVQLDDSKMKIKILQDALTFRSEEIGLAGHSDLLAKVAQMKDEVGRLKSQLQNKDSQLLNVQENNSTLTSEHSSLQEHINYIQQKLVHSQKEMHRLVNGDVVELLQATEQERDQLVNYIKQDMMKSVSLANQVEQLEYDMKVLQSRITEKDSQIESLLRVQENYHSESNNLQTVSLSQEEELKRMTHKIDNLAHELKSKNKAVESKTREMEILQAKLGAAADQLKSYQEEICQVNKEMFRLETSVKNYEQKLSSISNEYDMMKVELKNIHDENLGLVNRITVCEPKLRTIEPLYNTLLSENKDLKSRILSIELRASGLQSVEQLFTNLRRDFSELESTSLANKELNMSLAQRHAIWIGLPSLRNLSHELYEKIRILAQDLHKMETKCYELSGESNRLTQELIHKTELWNESSEYFQKQIENDKAKISSLLYESQQLEIKVSKDKENEEALFHLKSIVKFHPMFTHSEAYVNLYTTKGVEKFKDCFDDVPNEIVSQLFHQTLIDFSQLVNESTEDREAIKSFRALNSSLSENLAKYSGRCEGLEDKLRELNELLVLKEQKLEDLSSQFNLGLDEASELVERQNSFIITLEAKIEGLLKDLQQKDSQIQSFQHREYTLRHQVLSKCEKANIPVPINFTKVDTNFNMNELMNFIFDYIFRSKQPFQMVSDIPSSHFLSQRETKMFLPSEQSSNIHQLSPFHSVQPFSNTFFEEKQYQGSSDTKTSANLQERLKKAHVTLIAAAKND